MNEKERKSCIFTIKTLMNLAYNIHGVMDVVDVDNCKKIIEMLGAVQSKMDNMEKTVNGLKEDVKKLKVNQKYMWEDIEKLDKHIGMVESDVRQIKEYVVIYKL